MDNKLIQHVLDSVIGTESVLAGVQELSRSKCGVGAVKSRGGEERAGMAVALADSG